MATYQKLIKSGGSASLSSLTLTGLTASRLVASDASKALASVADLTVWVKDTANQIVSTSDGAGGLTLSAPQDLDTACDFQAATLTLSGNQTLTGGGSILSTSDGDITIDPDGTGVVTLNNATVTVNDTTGLYVGGGTPTRLAANQGNFYVTNEIEVDGEANFDGVIAGWDAIRAYSLVEIRDGNNLHSRFRRGSGFCISANANALRTLCVIDDAYLFNNTDFSTETYATFAIFGGDPNVTNNTWGKVQHNTDDLRISTGVNVGTGSGDAAARTKNNGIIFAPRETDKVMVTPLGGIAIKLTNETGANSEAGRLVKADTAADDAVILTGVDDDECIGVMYEDGVADGSETWIVVSGIADVLFDDNHGPARGDWVETSEAGYAFSQASPAAAPTHFQEIGHCVETTSAGGLGTHVAARVVLHFN